MSEWTLERVKPVAQLLVRGAHADGQVPLEYQDLTFEATSGERPPLPRS